jgi:hypothetical protein
MNAFYTLAINRFSFITPVVFLDNKSKAFVEPLNSGGIDVQVFHPKTTFEFGRPSWLFGGGYKGYELTSELLKFKGHLIQAVIEQDDLETVPVDQFVIDETRALVLRPGEYLLRIIDINGSLVGICSLVAR